MAVGTPLHGEQQTRRNYGRYYTPRPVAEFMLRRCFNAATCPHPAALPTILDPACGEGVFLLAAFDQVVAPNKDADAVTAAPSRVSAASTPFAHRLAVVRDCLFGVDNDEQAINSLKQALMARIDAPPRFQAEVRRVLSRNFHAGDALTGRSLLEPVPSTCGTLPSENTPASSVDWATAFPHIAAAGGFDLVIGNPPYLRERSAREVFLKIAETHFGKRWRQARMDLWYYFLHRALDQTRPGGQVCFIVNSYWNSSSGAGRLIERLANETTIEEIVELGSLPIFDGVSGRHQIFRLTRGASHRPCHVLDASRCARADWNDLAEHSGTTSLQSGASTFTVPQSRLYQHGRLVVRPIDPLLEPLTRCALLQEHCDVRQGVAENPPRISAAAARSSQGQWRTREGVFVLNSEEIRRLQLSEEERKLLKPYYAAAHLGRYCIAHTPTQWILYLTRDTAPTLDRLPGIEAHLARFRELLERRREVRNRRIAWWHLHWPREPRLFTDPRILSVQMGKQPQFVWAEQPTFVGFAVNVIQPRLESPWTAAALTAVLNSQLARRWFECYAKRRGVRLEISGGLLQQFPLPQHDLETATQLARLVSLRQALPSPSDPDHPSPKCNALEADIESLVSKLYAPHE